jgi:hypothetical protein
MGEEVGKRYKRVSMCKYYIHMYVNEKIIPIETVPGMGRGEDNGK